MKTDQEKIEVMQAHLRGEKIDCCFELGGVWKWVPIEKPTWDWYGCDYRIATREPRRVWLVNVPAAGEVTYAYPTKSIVIPPARAIEFVEVLP